MLSTDERIEAGKNAYKPNVTLSETVKSTVENALSVALEKFRENVTLLAEVEARPEPTDGSIPIIAASGAKFMREQFEQQIKETERVLDLLTRAGTVELRDIEPEEDED